MADENEVKGILSIATFDESILNDNRLIVRLNEAGFDTSNGNKIIIYKKQNGKVTFYDWTAGTTLAHDRHALCEIGRIFWGDDKQCYAADAVSYHVLQLKKNHDHLLEACKLAYRKHVLNDDSVGWGELGDWLLDAICDAIGDDGYQKWLKETRL